jgi:phosphoesterase RecJ-like protein
LEDCRRPLLVTHRRPDGDAIGALAAMTLALRELGLDPQPTLLEPLPPRYELLRQAVRWHRWDQERDALIAQSDAVVIVDTCAWSQLEELADYLPRAPRTLVIDHHPTPDPIATRPGDLRVLDQTAGAVCLLVTEWLRAIGLRLNTQMATALLTGLGTDCGWFRYSNTDARVLRTAAELVEAGAPADRIYRIIYEQAPPARLRLIGRMLGSLELHADGRLAVMTLRQADFQAADADHTMTEDLVNEGGRLAGVEAVLLFTEEADGRVRVNFRSKQVLDVSELAGRFGGGGHVRAAGARPSGTWDEVLPRVIAATLAALGTAIDSAR